MPSFMLDSTDLLVKDSLENNCTINDENGWSALLSTVPCSECSSVNSLTVSIFQSYGYSRNLKFICSNVAIVLAKHFLLLEKNHLINLK